MKYDTLVQTIVTLHREALGRAAVAVNRSLFLRNGMIGAYLVEFEQDGADRTAHGTGLLSRLSRDFRQHDVKGVSPDVLKRMRLLYLHYPQLRTRISATVTRNFPGTSSSALQYVRPKTGNRMKASGTYLYGGETSKAPSAAGKSARSAVCPGKQSDADYRDTIVRDGKMLACAKSQI